jgi:hypothetical protein
MKKKLLICAVLFVVYVFIPGAIQQIFMAYDDYYFYIIVAILLIINIFFAFNVFNLSNVYNIIAAAFVTTVGILSVQIVRYLEFGFKGITIAIFCNAISSMLAWYIVFQLKKRHDIGK